MEAMNGLVDGWIDKWAGRWVRGRPMTATLLTRNTVWYHFGQTDDTGWVTPRTPGHVGSSDSRVAGGSVGHQL